jgi:hypothetical protein
MEYEGRLFGKVGKRYIPLSNVTADFKMLENRVRELEAENEILRKSKQLNIPVIVRGGASETKSVHRHENDLKWDDFLDKPNTPTEPLAAEGSAKSVCGGHYTAMCKYQGGDCKCTSICLFE